MKGFNTSEIKAYKGTQLRHKEAREREFTKLYQDSYGLVYNYVRSRMSDDDAAQDIVSDAYLKAARHFGKFDPARAKFSTWVIKIATNLMISYWRKNRPTSALEDVPDKFVSQDPEQDKVEDRDFVDFLLATLEDEERILVVMKYREGYRNVEIAEELGMNASTVSTKLAKALAKMKAVAERNM